MYPVVLSIVFEQFVENQLFRRFYYVGIFPILHKLHDISRQKTGHQGNSGKGNV